ncbi:MFS family permease [Pseudarthrobacter defluvii]|uniref:MFS family permease n=1 Tax=Pseudarthrobacter defluvii TaxID=410837 RepID=A0ABT9UME9_9MICC|nr:MFS transporter [Pseudarthrobacter defluvii]MDQ0120813.1 MFS family permease [Pseudarthrobacter defluvii]
MSSVTEARATRAVVNKVLWRIMPFIGLLYFISFIDRIAISFAGPHGMTADLNLTATVFGLASGIFFAGYILLEVPSNIALQRFGARVWLTRIIITWGIVQALMAFVPSAEWLIGARFLLGVAEAGFAPGVLVYLMYWIPKSRRVWAFSLFLLVPYVTNAIGGPLMTWLALTSKDLIPGLAGWRTMILITGIAAIAAGVAAWVLLVDSPRKARWLSTEERETLLSAIAQEQEVASDSNHRVMAGLKNPKVLLLSLAFFSLPFGFFGLTFFLPTIVAGFKAQLGADFTPTMQAGLTSLPWICGIIGALVLSTLADRTGRPGAVTLLSGSIGALGALGAAFVDSPFTLIVMLSIAAFGLSAIAPTVFAIVPKVVAGTAAVAATALVNSLGSIGGFVGPYLTGFVTDLTGTQDVTYFLMAGFLVLGGFIALSIDNRHRRIVGIRSTGAPGLEPVLTNGNDK